MRSERGPYLRTAWALALLLGVSGAGAGASGLPGDDAITSAAGASYPNGVAGPVGSPDGTAQVTDLRAASFTTALPDQRAAVAIATAMKQIGLPYVWGGNGPTAGHAGFDCSGLTTFAYAAAGVQLPRTAHTQFYAGPHVPAGAPLQPGDLVFYGNAVKIFHVGLYIGDGRMVVAPTFGKPVQVSYYRWRGDQYFGATRPAATGGLSAGMVPYVPPPTVDAQAPSEPREFDAPPAPLPATPLPSPTELQPSEADTAAAALAGSGKAPREFDAPPAPLPAAPLPSPTELQPSEADTAAAALAGRKAPRVDVTTPSGPTAGAEGETDPDVIGTTDPAAGTTARPTVDPTTRSSPPDTTRAMTPAAPTSPPASSEAPEAAAGPSITIAGSTVELTNVGGADGIPSGPGLWAREGRPVVRLSSARLVAAAGSSVELSRPGAAVRTYDVVSRGTVTTDAAAQLVAAAGAGDLVVLAPLGEGLWMVLTAG